jgi:hypothetical protein
VRRVIAFGQERDLMPAEKIAIKVRRVFLGIFLHPLFGGAATVFGVIAGYVGSHYDAKIFEATYPIFFPSTTFSWEASAFWLFTLLFGMSFTGTFWAQSLTSKKTNDELQEALRELVTVPPRGFIQSYKTYCVSAIQFATQLDMATLNRSKIEEAIRFELDILVKTVADYDASGVDTVYGANIMLFYDAQQPFFGTIRSQLESRIKCIEAAVDIANLTGVLDLALELSVRSDTNCNKDGKLTPLALPIPKPPAGVALQTVKDLVPGAPFSFATTSENVYADQQELLDEINGNHHFTVKVADELKLILRAQAKEVQSLICIPLYAPLESAPSQPIAVLNIHKNRSDRQAPGKFLLLGPLLAPMTLLLGNLVSAL